MQKFLRAVLTTDYALFWVGGLGLAFMMLVTLTDVVMRYLGRPVFGSMELVCFTSAVVIGFAIPTHPGPRDILWLISCWKCFLPEP